MKSESDTTGKRVRVADIEDVEIETGCSVEVYGRRLALFIIDGDVVCVDERCPHAGGRLSRGQLCGSVVKCPRHGWRFDLVDGRCLSDPRYELGRYPVEIEEGAVFVFMTLDKE